MSQPVLGAGDRPMVGDRSHRRPWPTGGTGSEDQHRLVKDPGRPAVRRDQRSARLMALTSASSEAVTMFAWMPTPQSVRPSTAHSM
jgi:hypothetical protein